ncbi:hypothetical protein D1AOALGA4SA_5261 [Olavius algarvensis Delta 1 endosymbiont]|nr:hypothetical protein D1AOALGA4SA_5261 [Olavius algarvensis Delta 1 endosymbiont]
MLDAGCWMLDAGYLMLDAGCWILDAGYWVLGIRPLAGFFRQHVVCYGRCQVSVFSAAAGLKNGQSDQYQKLCSYYNVGSATVPTGFGGHGGPPDISKISGFTGGS